MSDQENQVVFEVKRMLAMLEKDPLIKRMYEGLKDKNLEIDERALEALFNSEVYDDSMMEDVYLNLEV
jgi:hypothetical protein